MPETPLIMEELSQAECLAALADHHFGRIAVIVEGKPSILPVNYLFDDSHVVIRTDPGTKLDGAAQGHVAFEVDEIDESARRAWSVLVTGVGYEITDALDASSQTARSFPVDTWAPGAKAHWIRIEPQSITGRRLRPA